MVSERSTFLSQLRHIDPYRMMREGREIAGAISIASLTRLSPLLAETEGEAFSEAIFSRDEIKRCIISVKIKTSLVLTCQRCLANYRFDIDRSFQVSAVEDTDIHDEESLPDDYEPILVENGFINLLDTIEDELLLSLPLVAMHEDIADCVEQGYRTKSEALDLQLEKDEQAPVNPFRVLKKPVDDEK